MKQIVLSYKSGELKVDDVPAPRCKPGGVVVRTIRSLISAGTERSLIDLGRKTIAGKAAARPDLVRRVIDKARKEGIVSTFKVAMGRLDEPVGLGYSAAGVVVEVGAGVTEFSVGDRVACIGAGFAMHAELIWSPRNLCAHVPEGVSDEEAAYGMLGIIALHGVRCAQPQLGHRVAVIGLGLLGNLAVQQLRAAGAEVLALDIDPSKVELARALGASWSDVIDESTDTKILELTAGTGVDAVVLTVAARDRKPLDLATEICARGGRVVLVGVCEIEIDRQKFWEKQIEFMVSRSGGPGAGDSGYELRGQDYPQQFVRWTEKRNLETFLELVRQRKVLVERLTTHRFPIERGMEAYGLFSEGREPYIGVLLTYPEQPDTRRTLSPPSSRPRTTSRSMLNVGVIGAGLFARATFLPVLESIEGIRLDVLAATNGMSATHLGRKFGFSRTTTEHEAIFADSSIDAVFILTRHDSHASLVEQALRAGKHVFVEKPLCMTEDELRRIVDARRAAPDRIVMVGYNRRFSPLTTKVLEFIGDRRAPATIDIRVNAGSIPSDHWAHSAEEGGGRIVSEACHFVDLAIALTRELPIRVYARAATAPGGANLGDEVCMLLTMSGGSVAQILYTGAGDRSFSRERIEVFSGGSVAAIEDFKSGELCRSNRRQTLRRLTRDMGHRGEVDAFVRGVREGREPIPFEEILGSTLATLGAVESLRSGRVHDCASLGPAPADIDTDLDRK